MLQHINYVYTDIDYLAFTIWRSLFSCLVKSHSGSCQRRGNGFFSFFDTYLQIIIYKSYPVVNIKFLYKVDNFSNRCKFLFLQESCVWETFFALIENLLYQVFLKLSRIFSSLLQGEIGILSGLCGFTTLRNMQHFMHATWSYRMVWNAESRCHDWPFMKVHKTLYKPCSIKKATNAVTSAFVAFLYVSKLALKWPLKVRHGYFRQLVGHAFDIVSGSCLLVLP